jgi:kinesin family member 2/24
MSNLKIFVRIKPSVNNIDTCVDSDNNNIIIDKRQKSYANTCIVKCKYKFDKIFDDSFLNIDIYNYLSTKILKSVIKNNLNATFYVYGQTGSGKTHTILGNQKDEEGIFSLILNDIVDINYKVKVSIIEIYNNKCYDVLNNKININQREDYDNNFIVNNIVKKDIHSHNNVLELKKIILENRKTGVSSENDSSSRSHLQINIEFNNRFIRLLDLAGCEKAKVSICNNRSKYKENGEINQSLFALKECIRSLVDNKKHIPYRRCELTKMLKQSFEPDCKTYILSTISQELYNANTTVDVLNYISDMKNIKCVQKKMKPKLKPKQIPSSPKIHRKISTSPKMNFHRDYLNCANTIAAPSPKYNIINSHKHILQQLSDMESNILNQIIHKKSSKDLFDEYVNILDKKKNILKYNYQNEKKD